jgi:hypothetical protein
MMGRTMTSFWYVISGGIQSEDTFYLGFATSHMMVFFSIRGSEFSLLYVLRWTFRTEFLDIKITYIFLFNFDL